MFERIHKPRWTIWLPILLAACLVLLYVLGRPAFSIWVMDAGNVLNETHLVKLCPGGQQLSQMQFGQSGGFGIDPARDILWAPELGDVDQIHYNEIVQLDNRANLIDRFQGYRADRLAVDPRDGSVWVNAWISTEQRTRLIKLAPNGKPLRAAEGFSQVYSLALDPRDGSLWVADGVNRTLTHLSADGERLFEMPTPGHFFSNAAHQIAVDPRNGDVWFTTSRPSLVHRLSAGGEKLLETGGLSSPVAVTIDPISGNVWVADYDLLGSGAIVKLAADGRMLLTQALPSHALSAVVNPFDGTLWVGVDGELLRYDDEGNVLGRIGGLNQPVSLAFAPSGNDWLTRLRCTLILYQDPLK
jgi:streptogramin lyase